MKRIDVIRLEVVRERQVEYGNKKISCGEDLADLGQKLIGKADREMFVVVCLNAQSFINGISIVSVGTLTATLITAREVYKYALLSNSASILVMHNHPSGGRITPSKEDIEITKMLIEAGRLLDVELVDHVIISEGNYYSFLDKGTCNFG